MAVFGCTLQQSHSLFSAVQERWSTPKSKEMKTIDLNSEISKHCI
jgi:hypothetical protein